LDKSISYELFEPLFGKGLVTAPGKVYLLKNKI